MRVIPVKYFPVIREGINETENYFFTWKGKRLKEEGRDQMLQDLKEVLDNEEEKGVPQNCAQSKGRLKYLFGQNWG